MVELEELLTQLVCIGGLNTGLASRGEESFDATMPEALNYVYSVSLHVSGCKGNPLCGWSKRKIDDGTIDELARTYRDGAQGKRI